MVNYYIYARDVSGSTRNDRHYHSNGLKTLEQFKNDVERIEKELLDAGEPQTESKILYLHWGHECYEVNEDRTRQAYIDLACDNMWTRPECIVKWIQENYDIFGEKNEIKLLYIITDGLIEHNSEEQCFKMNENRYYKEVVFHAFNKDLNRIDLSVAASFFKSRCVIYRNYELFDDTDISQDFDYDTINADNFAEEKERLKSYIKLKFMNKMKRNDRALQEIDKLKKLRNRLFNECSSESQKSRVNLNTKDRDEFMREFVRTEWYKTFIVSVPEKKIDIEQSITTLINFIISEKKCYSFDALKFDTKFQKPVEEEPIADIAFEAEHEIQFPDIILEDDKGIPVVILTEFDLLDKIIFHRTKEMTSVSPASFSKFKSTMDCPLYLVNDPDISESIGYFYTLNVFKQFLSYGTRTEPRTRKPFHGGLVLTDTNEFDKYNDYVLSATYFNFKKIRFNVGLFYYVLWKNSENKEWMDRNVVQQFKKYVMRRISTTVCKIGLSSLPLDPQEITSLLTALWYCVDLSTNIFKSDPINFTQERLRMYYGVAHCMIEILKYFDYDLDLESIEKRIDLIRHVMILKQIPRRIDKMYYLLQKIFKTVGGFLVHEIEKPCNLYKLNYLDVNHRGMLCDDVVEGEVHLNNYVHLMHFVEDWCVHDICEKTFRPYFTLDENKSFYTELVKATKKVVIINDDDKDKIEVTYDKVDSLEFDKILSLYNLFIKCVQDYEKYPTLSEYIEYISKKKKFNGDLVTIFSAKDHSDAEEVYEIYKKVMKNVDACEFIKVSKDYVGRHERIKVEEVMKFNNDNEIEEFIINEEAKVNLKNIVKV